MGIMYNQQSNTSIFDLYSIDKLRQREHGGDTSIPFVWNIILAGPKGEKVRSPSMVDNWAIVNAIDEKTFLKSKHRLEPLRQLAQ